MVSTEGFISSSFISAAPSVVLNDLSFISSRVIASSPYNSLNGVNLVVLDSVVLCDHKTLGSSSAYLPFGSSAMFFLMLVNMMPLALSTAPFDCG